MPDDGAPEAVLFFVALIPDAFELVEVVLDQGKEVGGPRIAGPVDSWSRALHIRSNRWTASVAKNINNEKKRASSSLKLVKAVCNRRTAAENEWK